MIRTLGDRAPYHEIAVGANTYACTRSEAVASRAETV